MSEPIRVLLVDDDPMVRAGLKLMFAPNPDLDIVGEAADGDEVLDAVAATHPQVILMDLGMKRVDGIEATRRVIALPDAPQVIALTTWDVDDAVLRCLEAGASGFLLKGASPAEIAGAVRDVVAGDAVLSPHATRQLIDHLSRSRGGAPRVDVSMLTERERTLAGLVGEGLTNPEIAAREYISVATVKTHLGSIQDKLGVPNRVGIAVAAERAGLIRR